MDGEAVLETMAIVGFVTLGLYNAKRRRERGEVPIPKQEGTMTKAIKITMGICFGLMLVYLLFGVGALVLSTTIAGH